MVEDRILEEIETRTKNLLKHMPCRSLKFKEVKEIVSPETTGVFAVRVICLGPNDVEIESISLWRKKDAKDPEFSKTCVKGLKDAIPEIYKKVNVSNVTNSSKEILSRFSMQEPFDTFIIEQLPYRQLKVNVEGETCFVDLSNQTYQRILSFLSKETKWPCSVDFEKFSTVFKRKELVTLCIRLSQLKNAQN